MMKPYERVWEVSSNTGITLISTIISSRHSVVLNIRITFGVPISAISIIYIAYYLVTSRSQHICHLHVAGDGGGWLVTCCTKYGRPSTNSSTNTSCRQEGCQSAAAPPNRAPMPTVGVAGSGRLLLLIIGLFFLLRAIAIGGHLDLDLVRQRRKSNLVSIVLFVRDFFVNASGYGRHLDLGLVLRSIVM